MADNRVREPNEIRQDCVEKLHSLKTVGMVVAVLGYFLGEDWAAPKIEELRISPERRVLARVAGDATLRSFIGAEGDLIRTIRDIAESAELDGDEIGYLLAKVAEIKRG